MVTFNGVGRIVAALAMAAAALVGTAAPASAAPQEFPPLEAAEAKGSSSLTLTATRSTGLGVQEVITCSIDIGVPTKVSFGGILNQIEVTGFTNCTAPVSSINHTTTLYYVYQGIPLWADARTGLGTKNVTTVPYYPSCLAGPWYGVAGAFVIFPPNFVPPNGRIGKTSLTSNITC